MDRTRATLAFGRGDMIEAGGGPVQDTAEKPIDTRLFPGLTEKMFGAPMQRLTAENRPDVPRAGRFIVNAAMGVSDMARAVTGGTIEDPVGTITGIPKFVWENAIKPIGQGAIEPLMEPATSALGMKPPDPEKVKAARAWIEQHPVEVAAAVATLKGGVSLLERPGKAQISETSKPQNAEVFDATQERKIAEGHQPEYQGAETRGLPGETGGRNRYGQGGQIAPETQEVVPRGAAPKEPWEMTFGEYFEDFQNKWRTKTEGKEVPYGSSRSGIEFIGEYKVHHKAEIDKALSKGKPVPPEVLADYPDLVPRETAQAGTTAQMASKAPAVPVGETPITPVQPPTKAAVGPETKAGETPPTATKPVKTGVGEADLAGLKRAETDRLRQEMELEPAPPVRKKAFQVAADEANERGLKDKALEIADDVKTSGRTLDDAEFVGLAQKASDLGKDYDAAIATVNDLTIAGNKEAAALERGRAESIRANYEKIIEASEVSGTEQSRNFSIRRLLMNRETYELVDVIREARIAKGKDLTPAEQSRFEALTADVKAKTTALEQMTAKWEAEHNARLKSEAEITARREMVKARISRKAAGARESIQAERVEIKKQLQALGYRANEVTGVSLEASYLVGKLAINYMKEGAVTLSEVVQKVLADLPDLTESDVYRAINSRNPKLQKRLRNETHVRIFQLKQQARLLTELENAEKGVFEKRPSIPQNQSAEIRELRRQLRVLRAAAYKKGNTTTQAGLLKQTLARIGEAEKQLTGQYRAIRKGQTVPSPEVATARDRLAAIRQDMGVQDKIADLGEKVRSAEKGVFTPTKSRPAQLQAIRELQTKLKGLRKAAYKQGNSDMQASRLERTLQKINEAQDQLANQYRAVRERRSLPSEEVAAAQQKLAEIRRLMSTTDKLTDLQEQLRTGEFKQTKKVVREVPPNLERAQIDLKRARTQVRSAIEGIAPWKPGRIATETMSTLRTLKATADLSATLRQGLVLVSSDLLRNPARLARNVGRSLQATFSKYKAEQIDNALRNRPTNYLGETAGLKLSELDGPISAREEYFAGNYFENLPVIKQTYGQVIKASNRHMTTFLNLIRTAAFDDFIAKYPNATRPELKAWADFINVASGKGNLPVGGGWMKVLNATFFAPKFAVSRFQTPWKLIQYARRPRVRKMIARDMASTVGLGMAALALAKYGLQAEVGDDPRKSDFGKIRVGDTRIDIWGGFQQPARLIARIALASTDARGLTGEELTKQEKDVDPFELMARFAMFKLSPTITLGAELGRGKDVIGQPVSMWQIGADAVFPIMVQDIYDAYKSDNALHPVTTGALTILGVGTSTYPPSEADTRVKIREFLDAGKIEDARALRKKWNAKQTDPEKRIKEVKTSRLLKVEEIQKLRKAGQKEKAEEIRLRWNEQHPTQKIGGGK